MAEATEALLLRLDGFEGPLDLLLDLARAEKLDLSRISMGALVDQYLAIVDGARRVRLELRADWLVMAAWLAWLKSRLLLPPGTAEAEEAEEAADVLAARLRELRAIRAAAAFLAGRPRLGEAVFARGAPEPLTEIDRSRLVLDVAGLVRAYLAARRRGGRRRQYRPRPVTPWTVVDALRRLERLLRHAPGWSGLERFLPDGLADPLARRAATASTLMAGLELARGGAVRLRQDQPFGPVLLRAGGEEE